jgi:MEMO1 family protein
VSDTCPLARRLAPNVVEANGERYVVLDDPWGLAPEGIALPIPYYHVLALCDGDRSLEDIQAELVMQWGRFVAAKEVDHVLRELGRFALLEGPVAEQRLSERLLAFGSAPRPAIHAGVSYPSDPGELGALIDGWIEAAPSPGCSAGASAVIAPHIDYARGHEAYGAAYRGLRECVRAETFIVLGVQHGPSDGPFCFTRQGYDTPFGAIATDVEAVERLAEAAGQQAPGDELLHGCEHSVEFQAVILKHIVPEARIAPVLCAYLDRDDRKARRSADRLAARIRELLSEPDGRYALVLGVDLSHVGPEFGHPECPHEEVDPWAQTVDRAVLEAALRGDPEGVLVECGRVSDAGEDPNVCGQSALYVAARALGQCHGRILSLTRAPTPDGSSWVGFGAGLIYTE